MTEASPFSIGVDANMLHQTHKPCRMSSSMQDRDAATGLLTLNCSAVTAATEP
jgi:hypothetical protein